VGILDSIQIESNGLVVSLSVDSFNSEHFGLKMGNISLKGNINNVKNIEIKCLLDDLLEQAKLNKFEHLTYKVNTNDKVLVKELGEKNFFLADTLLTYVFDFEKQKLNEVITKVEIGNCKNEDIQILKEISKNSFKIDRFHSDNSLDANLSDAYYEKWFENSAHGLADRVIVAYLNDKPIGYTTCKIYPDDEYGWLVLSAVSSDARGLGVYTSMIHEGVQWIESNGKGLNGVKLGTQINNIAVQKAWIKLGFTVLDSHYIFHKSLK